MLHVHKVRLGMERHKLVVLLLLTELSGLGYGKTN